MTDYVIDGDPPVPVVLRRSGRARRISLRISQLDGRVTLTCPASVSDGEALAFARDRADWLRGHLGRVPERVSAHLGTEIPVEGRMRRIVPGTQRGVQLRDDAVAVSGPGGTVPRRLAAFLKTLARDRLAAASDEYAARLGRGFSQIRLRDTRSRWGSCTSQGALMYSWRLILAPPDILRYVAAHEVAHLAEMNHSDAYWTTLEQIHGPYAQPRHWLRAHGQDLHRYRFEA